VYDEFREVLVGHSNVVFELDANLEQGDSCIGEGWRLEKEKKYSTAAWDCYLANERHMLDLFEIGYSCHD